MGTAKIRAGRCGGGICVDFSDPLFFEGKIGGLPFPAAGRAAGKEFERDGRNGRDGTRWVIWPQMMSIALAAQQRDATATLQCLEPVETGGGVGGDEVRRGCVCDGGPRAGQSRGGKRSVPEPAGQVI